MILENEPPRVPYPSLLDRQTLAEDQRYQSEISRRRPTVFFRPDDRSDSSRAGYWEATSDGVSYIRFITQYGSHAEARRPLFSNYVEPVKILSRIKKQLKDVTREECTGAYLELSTTQAILAWLRQKYPGKKLGLNSIIMVYTIMFLE